MYNQDSTLFSITKGEYLYSGTLLAKERDLFYLFLKLKHKFERDMSRYPIRVSFDKFAHQSYSRSF